MQEKSILCAIQTLLRAKKCIVSTCWSYDDNRISEVDYRSLRWIVFFDYSYSFKLEFKNGWKLYR